MRQRKYKVVIFDYDDTLVESRVVKWAHHKYVAKKFYNIDITEEALLKHWGKPIYTLISELYQNSDSIENMYAALISVRNNFPKKIYKESLRTVKKLLAKSIKVGILSATSNTYLYDDLAKYGFPIDSFTFIQGSDDTTIHKPNPGVFIPILSLLSKEGIKEKEAVYVGDSLIDLKAAHGAGIDFIAVTTGLYSKEDFKKHGAKTIINNIAEIHQIII